MDFRILLVFITLLFFVEAQWCRKPVSVLRTRIVTRIRYGYFHTRHAYTAQEQYRATEIQRDCCDGYLRISNNCLPQCAPNCPTNSHCSKPGTCTCNAGYSSSYSGDCQPICEKGCPKYSTCTEPSVCKCNEGYELLLGTCQPKCATPCREHSHCEAPNECKCDANYVVNEASECVPHCQNGCGVNSYCREPDKCACMSGYEADAYNICQPSCSIGCPAYSKCVEPETCQCEEGYQMNANATQCEAICAAGCPPKSVCYRPNECLCDEGYRLQKLPGMNLYCEPDCPANCTTNGKCVTPNKCECFAGYEQSAQSDVGEGTQQCQPKCSGNCENGFCFAPEECICNPGFLMGPNKTCAPTCSLGCVHGDCVEPEICSCSPGHRFAANSVNVCEPICEPGCIQADCVAPNVCICWQNYEPKANDLMHECVPSCTIKCGVHGVCSAPNVCDCHEGYELNGEASGDGAEACSLVVSTTITTLDYDTTTDDFSSPTTWNTELFESTTADYPVDYSTVSDSATTASRFTEPFSSTTTSELLVSSKLCHSHCKCWQEFDEFGLLSSAKCLHVCLDDSDEPCLNLRNCLCDFPAMQLVCNNTEDPTENLPNRYACKMPFFPTTTTTNRPAFKSDINKLTEDANEAIPTWLVTLICIVAIAVLVGAVYIVWNRYMVKKEPDYSYTVDYLH